MLLGGQREVAHINQLLQGAQDGTSAALLLQGEPGIGKSTLLRAAVDRALESGFTVVQTRGFESESDIPFAGLLELLTPLLHLRDRIPQVQARALGSALALEPPTPFDRFAVPAGMLSLLAAAAEKRPLLVASASARSPGATARASSCARPAARRRRATRPRRRRSVEYHLSQIHRKLDLRSRTQLATLMASEMPDAKAA